MRDLTELFDKDRLAAYPRLVLITYAIAFVALWTMSTGLIDPRGVPIGSDFITFWSAGRLALEGNAAGAFDSATILSMQRVAVPGSDKLFLWHYPPTFHLMAAALASVPYLASYFFFTAAGATLYVLALRPLVPWREAGILLLALPGAFVCMLHGQNSLLSAALLAGALLLIDQRPVVAGICIGLLAYKPQLGVLFPLALAFTGRWLVMAVAAATVTVFAGLATLVLGFDLWNVFFSNLAVVRDVMESGQLQWDKMPSAFVFLRKLGVGQAAAYAAQSIVAITAAAVTFLVWWRSGPTRLAGATLVSATLLLSPYTFDYEMAILAIPLAVIAGHLVEHGADLRARIGLIVIAVTPAAMGSIVAATAIQLGFIALLATFVWAARLALASPAGRTSVIPAGLPESMLRPLS